jgi:hypothetical protein
VRTTDAETQLVELQEYDFSESCTRTAVPRPSMYNVCELCGGGLV